MTRAAAVSALNGGSGAAFEQPLFAHPIDQFHQIRPDSLGGSIVLIEKQLVQRTEPSFLLNQGPDPRTHGVQAEVHAGLQVEQDGLVPEIVGQNVFGNQDNCLRGHHFQSP
jgi:hypothetical protein